MEVVVVPVGIPLVGEVDITAVASDTLVCTPDVDVVVVTNDDLASALALTLSASELSENSCEYLKDKFMIGKKFRFCLYFELIVAVGCCGY